MRGSAFTIAFLLTAGFTYAIGSSSGYNYPASWSVLESEHFKVIFYEEERIAAEEILRIAEEVYDPISRDFDVKIPTKTPIIVASYDDYSNGFASPITHSMKIHTPSMTEVTTEALTWLRRVVAHEFAHIATFWKVTGPIPYVEEFWALWRLPSWFIEGIAQFAAETYDGHRDMLLRNAAPNDSLLSYDKMSVPIGYNIYEGRLMYEQGYSILRFAAARYGRKSVFRILDEMRNPLFSFDDALKSAIGIDSRELYNSWWRSLTAGAGTYASTKDDISSIAERLTGGWGWNMNPRYSPDGSKIAFVSSRKNDFSKLALYVMDADGGDEKEVDSGVDFSVAWADDDTLIYSKKGISSWAYTSDLFEVKLSDPRSRRRITEGLRAYDPDVSPDGRKIAFIRNHNGSSSDVFIMDRDGGNLRRLTKGQFFDQHFAPRFSGDGKKIVYSIFRDNGKRDVWMMSIDGEDVFRLTDDYIDDRSASFAPDDDMIIFTSSPQLREGEWGAPNLFVMSPDGEKRIRLTDLFGGAYGATFSPDGREIAFSYFEGEGFAIYRMPVDYPALRRRLGGSSQISKIEEVEKEYLPDHTPPPHIEYPYTSLGNIQPIYVLPSFRYDKYNLELGGAAYAYDHLEHHTFDISLRYHFALNRPNFRIGYTNKMLPPTLRLDLSNGASRYSDDWGLEGQSATLTVSSPLGAKELLGSVGFTYSRSATIPVSGEARASGKGTEIYNNTINLNYLLYEDIEPRKDEALQKGAGRTFSVGAFWSNELWGSTIIRRREAEGLSASEATVGVGDDTRITIQSSDGTTERAPNNYIALTQNYWEYIDLNRSERSMLASRLASGILEGSNLGTFVFGPAHPSFPGVVPAIRGLQKPVSGNRYILSTGELRFPLNEDLGAAILWQNLYLEGLYDAIFIDAGKIWYNTLEEVGRIHTTVGDELRLRIALFRYVPVVIRAGVGIELDRGAQPQWFFSASTAF
ncbi:MAG: peptidase MA family metallohydrolase [bacterium]